MKQYLKNELSIEFTISNKHQIVNKISFDAVLTVEMFSVDALHSQIFPGFALQSPLKSVNTPHKNVQYVRERYSFI